MSEGRVLVVDDEEAIRHLIQINLELEGFEVRTAANGAEAMQLVRDFGPQVVTLDVMMPGLSGWQVAEKLIGSSETAHVKVILVSARAQATDREKGQALGVHGYVTKPFDPDELVAEVRRLCQPSG